MTDKDRKIAKNLRYQLSTAISLIDFRVFGSRAKGTAGEYSDMDVFIEVETLSAETESKIRDIVWEVGFDNSVYISPLIFTRYEIENSPLRSSSIVANIYKEGILV